MFVGISKVHVPQLVRGSMKVWTGFPTISPPNQDSYLDASPFINTRTKRKKKVFVLAKWGSKHDCSILFTYIEVCVSTNKCGHLLLYVCDLWGLLGTSEFPDFSAWIVYGVWEFHWRDQRTSWCSSRPWRCCKFGIISKAFAIHWFWRKKVSFICTLGERKQMCLLTHYVKNLQFF